LAAVPEEGPGRDSGCGAPTRRLRPGETVLDLGAGSGKACVRAAQVVGREGRVIGVDMNDEMLALARRHAPKVARRIGFANVTFRKAKIQDLRLDRDWLDAEPRARPVRSDADLLRLEGLITEQRAQRPLIPDGEVD